MSKLMLQLLELQQGGNSQWCRQVSEALPALQEAPQTVKARPGTHHERDRWPARLHEELAADPEVHEAGARHSLRSQPPKTSPQRAKHPNLLFRCFFQCSGICHFHGTSSMTSTCLGAEQVFHFDASSFLPDSHFRGTDGLNMKRTQNLAGKQGCRA